MAHPFWLVYGSAAVLLGIVFWIVGMTLENAAFALNCYVWSLVGLVSGYLQTHAKSAVGRGIGTLIWLGGLMGILTTLGNSWHLAVVSGASGDLVWLMAIAVVAVLVAYLVGRWWGEFYAALSFLAVPTLSLFGLTIPLIANIQVVFGIFAALVVGLFLVTTESLLLRWQRGQLGQVTPKFLVGYCWRLAVTGSAIVLTIGLLLVPPATWLHAPLTSQLLRLPFMPFFRYTYGTVEFPDLFTMPGGPINLPDVELFQVRGTTYPRWRVRVYAYYVGSGWRTSHALESLQFPEITRTPEFIELRWTGADKLPRDTVTAVVIPVNPRLQVVPSPGEALRLQLPLSARGIVMRTQSGCLQPFEPLQPPSISFRADSYVVTARPIPETLPLRRDRKGLSEEERRALSYFPPYLYRVRELALQVTRGAKTPYEKAKALETFLQTQYRYSDSPPYLVGRNIDVVTFFLFEAREGACDWFASALALMCRAVGIPTRVITGFYSDEVLSDGSLVIRASHAHAWVEAYIDGYGWVTLDATPSDGRRRSNLLTALRQWLARRYRASLANPQITWWFVALLWMLAMVPTMWKLGRLGWESYRPRPRWQVIVRCYLVAVHYGRKKGLPLHPNATPWENAQAVAKVPRFPVIGKDALRRLADLTVAILYAEQKPTRSQVKEAKRLLKVFRQSARLYAQWFAPRKTFALPLQKVRRWWQGK